MKDNEDNVYNYITQETKISSGAPSAPVTLIYTNTNCRRLDYETCHKVNINYKVQN